MSTDFSEIIKQKKQMKEEAASENLQTSASVNEKKKTPSKTKTAEKKPVMGRPKTKPDLGEEVNITAKVPKAWRIHWMTEIKRHDTTLREEIIEALTQKYGLPESKD